MRNNWTREQIIRNLLEREAKGLPLTVGGEGVDKSLYAAARRIFGSWRNAIQAAGIAPQQVLTWERWSPGRILVMIRHLARRERPLTTLQMERRYHNIVSAARRHFGSWNKAVLAAGVKPTKLLRVIQERQVRRAFVPARGSGRARPKLPRVASCASAAGQLPGRAMTGRASGADPNRSGRTLPAN